MGNSQINSELTLYGQAQHPINGQVIAYMIKSQTGKFIMKINMPINKEELHLFEKVGEGKNPKLIIYYGMEGKETINTNKNNTIQEVKDFENNSQINNGGQKFIAPLYWQFLNWDLQHERKCLEQYQEWVKEQMLWEILDNASQACQYLETFNLYPSLLAKNIQFSAGKQPKIYWCDILPNNMHRAYDTYITSGQFRHTTYAPQELIQINRIKRSNLDYQKCVIFVLGISLLQAASKTNIKYLYDYRRKVFSEVRKRQLMAKINGKYTHQFYLVLGKLLEYFAKDRYGYKELKESLDKHYNRGAFKLVISKCNEISLMETSNELPSTNESKSVVTKGDDNKQNKANTKKSKTKKIKMNKCFPIF